MSDPKKTVPKEQMDELRAMRDARAVVFSDLQVLQAEFQLATARLDKRRRAILMAIGASPDAQLDDETGEVTPKKAPA